MSDGKAAVVPLTAGATVLMVVLAASWGFGQTAMKMGADGFSPVMQTIVRSTVAAMLVFIWCRWRSIELDFHDSTLGPGLLAGALFGIEFLLLFAGLDYTTVTRGVLFLYAMPFWVMLGAHFLLGERMSARKLMAMALAFAGLVFAFSDRASRPAPDAWIGDLMILAGGMLWAATTLIIRTTSLAKASAEKVLLYQLGVSAVVTVPLMLLPGPHIRDVSMIPVLALLFQAIWVVAVTYLVWFWLVTRHPAASLSAFTFLTPVFGVLSSALLLGEPTSSRVWLALALIAAALVWANLPARAAPNPSRTDP